MSKKARTQAGPRPCIFCGERKPGNKMTGEHLWSNWMRDMLPASSHYMQRLESLSEVPQPQVTRRRREGATKGIKIEAVCKECNSGWMEKLDYQLTRPYLAPMIKGQFVSLDQIGRGLVARWIVLKNLVAEHEPPLGQSPRVVHPQSDRTDFFNYRRIPSGFQVWIGHSPTRGQWASAFFRQVGSLSLVQQPSHFPPPDLPPPVGPPNVQAITWGIGHLRVVAFSTANPDLYSRGLRLTVEKFTPIWPEVGQDIVWPPSARIVDRDMVELFRLVASAAGRRRLT